ncbi:MAG: adenine phosphoribosyltransferase [Dehalococcoidia bacterium]|nr:adenine phosphoribosyltransferase [Dehalococcoidia bacterium]
MDLASLIRDVPDFPQPGIVFKDITTLLQRPAALREVVDRFTAHYRDQHIDAVVAIESRGFIFGGALAYQLDASFVPVRKAGKLPAETARVAYELEYGSAEVQIHRDALEPGQRALILDDLLATGGTAAATALLVEGLRAAVAGIAFVIELDFLQGRQKLGRYADVIHTLIHY